MRAEVEKSFKICCMHELPDYPPCMEEHEHEYEVIINVLALLNEDTGMVVDYTDLDEVIARYDRKNLNNLMKTPTVENFALAVINDIVRKFEHYNSVTITIREEENTKVTLTRYC